MKCPSCQSDVPDGSGFCPSCGAQLADSDQLTQICIKDAEACEKAVHHGDGSREYLRKNFDTQLPKWQQAAQLGLPQAQWLLARCYEEGFGLELNKTQAISWLIKAAEQDYILAQTHLAHHYQNGDAVPKDDAEAVKWFTKAAQKGDLAAQSMLGWCYDTGTGVEENPAEAAKWFRMAAEKNDPVAQFNLAIHYQWGKGLEKDLDKAVELFRKAADQGYQNAKTTLKELLETLEEEKKFQAEHLAEAEIEFRRVCKDVLADGKVTLEEKDELKKLTASLEMPKALVKKIFEDEKKIFTKEQKKVHAKQATLKFQIACKNALADGKISENEKKQLHELSTSLKLPKEAAQKIFEHEKLLFKKSHKAVLSSNIEQQFRKACKDALADGKVTPEEEKNLKELAKFLKIPNENMKKMLADEIRIFKQARSKKT